MMSNYEGFFYFLIGILGQVWYLIVSIPDLCPLSYYVICCGLLFLTGNAVNKWYEQRLSLHGISLKVNIMISCKTLKALLYSHPLKSTSSTYTLLNSPPVGRIQCPLKLDYTKLNLLSF